MNKLMNPQFNVQLNVPVCIAAPFLVWINFIFLTSVFTCSHVSMFCDLNDQPVGM